MHSDVPALRLVSWMDVGVRAFLDMTDRSSSTPLKGTRICGHPAASKEAGSGTCAAIDWASRETTRPRTGSLCLTARNQVRDHLHVRADGMSRLAITILRSLDPQASPPDAVLAMGARILKYRGRLACPSIAPVDRLAGLRVLAAPPIDAAASEAIEIRSRRAYFVFHRFPWRSVHSRFTCGSNRGSHPRFRPQNRANGNGRP